MSEIITNNFKTLVGFRAEPGFDEILQTQDKTSDSALFFQDGHPLVTLVNVKSAAPLLLSGQEMSNTQFVEWLRQKEEASISRVVARVEQLRNLSRVDKTILDKSSLFDGSGNVRSLEIKEGRFVGYVIVVKNTNQIEAVIDQICLQFTERQNALKIYVYHSSQKDPVYVKELAVVKPNLPNWIDSLGMPLICSKSHEFGGYWLVGYYEDDATGQALNKDGFNFIKGGCNCAGIDPWSVWSKHLSIQPFYVNSADLRPGRILPWERHFNYTPEGNTYGLNMILSTKCAKDQILMQERLNFARAIQMQFCVDMLLEIAYTTRTSALSEKVQQKALYDLEDKENSQGLKTKLEKEIASININLEKLGPICMPQKNIINYNSIRTS